ncbi:cell division protein FtsA [Marinithermus hydrothermalis]|uniref:Cell division protein FtsA n=1 Tax=Marinithermus hydrothermalis (strain DSM 14884 / JCM 11576 / T1) TaxID=869210 RepID=F2NML8_MARHT|nr:cell division protein FtsA [Marinithermus hydrothermalis]AEB12188.1 cell division protein FtsA [Marinithermus hydrothermalis DSM 14884]
MSERIIVGLDVGTTKVCTVIGELASDGVLDIIGEGTVPSQGLKRGVVVNLERTTEAIRASVRAAERVAGVPAERVYVGVAGAHIRSVTSHGLAAIRRGHSITPADVERAIEQAKAFPFEGDHELIHALPLEYRVDGQEGIRDPVGMAGVRLEVDVHLVAGGKGPLANLRRAVEAAGLGVQGLVLQSYASGLSVLSPEELGMTVMLVDIGGGTTDVAVFRGGRLAHSAVVPLGGDHITGDIAQLLKIPFEEAERVKKKYGAALPELADPDLVLEINHEGNPMGGIPAPELARIIRPRVREILHLARSSVDEVLGPLEVSVSKVVLTGGAALMRGIEELARKQYNLPVRLGRPGGISGLTDVVSSPAHATAVGLVRFGALEDTVAGEAPLPTRPKRSRDTQETNLWERIKGIFKDFF